MSLSEEEIGANLASIQSRISAAATRAGRSSDEITLIAVSKTWPIEVIERAAAAGQLVFGENKVQEVTVKSPAMSEALEWHFIGHLQKNKVRKVLECCPWIHSIDSLELAERVDRIAADRGVRPKGLLQVNVAGDEAKFGLSMEEARALIPAMMALPQLELCGLMTVPEFDPDPEKTRPHFARLRELRDSLASEFGVAFPELSMGMSHDFEVAIEEGATFVRVGSSIFGQRDYAV
ncbi:MAG: YggS family pyridoxal phosphate-dependent enzyme [Verrucomicrobiota bacterium]